MRSLETIEHLKTAGSPVAISMLFEPIGKQPNRPMEEARGQEQMQRGLRFSAVESLTNAGL
jgi:hypothetical protein